MSRYKHSPWYYCRLTFSRTIVLVSSSQMLFKKAEKVCSLPCFLAFSSTRRPLFDKSAPRYHLNKLVRVSAASFVLLRHSHTTKSILPAGCASARALPICVSVCACVCVGERQKEREWDTEREQEKEGEREERERDLIMFLFIYSIVFLRMWRCGLYNLDFSPLRQKLSLTPGIKHSSSGDGCYPARFFSAVRFKQLCFVSCCITEAII